MSINLAKAEEAMLALDHSDLAALIHRGIQILDAGDSEASQDEIDSAWREELSKRIDDIENSRIQTVPADDVFARVRVNLAARRK